MAISPDPTFGPLGSPWFNFWIARQPSKGVYRSRLGIGQRYPDGYLIQVGQYTQTALDRFKNDAVDSTGPGGSPN